MVLTSLPEFNFINISFGNMLLPTSSCRIKYQYRGTLSDSQTAISWKWTLSLQHSISGTFPEGKERM